MTKNFLFRWPALMIVAKHKRFNISKTNYNNKMQNILKAAGIMVQDDFGRKRYRLTVKGGNIAEEINYVMQIMGIKPEDIDFSREKKRS